MLPGPAPWPAPARISAPSLPALPGATAARGPNQGPNLGPVVLRLQNRSQGLHALSVLLDDAARAELMARHGADLRIEPDDELQLQDQPGSTTPDRTLAPTNHFPAGDNRIELEPLHATTGMRRSACW